MRLKPFDLNYDALETKDHIKIAFATISAISIMKFVETAELKLFRIPLLNFIWCEAITFTRVLENEIRCSREDTISSSIRIAFTAYVFSSKYSAVSLVRFNMLVHT
jgi:hypothetical protein